MPTKAPSSGRLFGSALGPGGLGWVAHMSFASPATRCTCKKAAGTRHMLVRVGDADVSWCTARQEFHTKYLAATAAVVLIIGPFFAGHLRPVRSCKLLFQMRWRHALAILWLTDRWPYDNLPSTCQENPNPARLERRDACERDHSGSVTG